MSAPEQSPMAPAEVVLISADLDVRLFIDPDDQAHIVAHNPNATDYPWRGLRVDDPDHGEPWFEDDVAEAERLIPASPLLAFAHRISQDPTTEVAAGELRLLLAHMLGEIPPERAA